VTARPAGTRCSRSFTCVRDRCAIGVALVGIGLASTHDRLQMLLGVLGGPVRVLLGGAPAL
jgi:hypothetical protein